MTPSEVKQLTPDGYGGDFEITCTSEKNIQVEVQDKMTRESMKKQHVKV